GLSVVLTFVGIKMLTEGYMVKYFGLSKEAVIAGSLGVVAVVLLCAVAASLYWPAKPEQQVEVELPGGFDSPFDDDRGALGGDERGLPEKRQGLETKSQGK